MSILKIWQGSLCREVTFYGKPTVSEVLMQAGIVREHPCGGRGVCGKCAARITGMLSEPNAMEIKVGKRLTCQAVLLGDTSVWLPEPISDVIEASGSEIIPASPMGNGFGCAIDIGTTTLALKLYHLSDGKLCSIQTLMNPQRSVSADVMGRIAAAMAGHGHQLQGQITDALSHMLSCACADANVPQEAVKTAVVTGNTTMLYLLTGRDPACLSCSPFEADTHFGVQDHLLGMQVYYPYCMNAFVGADITCAVLASGMHEKTQTSLLCDIGTNGELALWRHGKLYVTSTAAGPAFEGAGITCGCGSIPGAIDKVWVQDGQIHAHTIGDLPAVGICGSGLIDAIAAFLETEKIDETGAAEADTLSLRDGIKLYVPDIRALQLAKAAIAAGIQTLLKMAQITEAEIEKLYIAGGFGSHLNIASAASIGLIPASLQDRVQVLGNAALTGAAQMLLDQRQISPVSQLACHSQHLNLGGNPTFNQSYMEQMLFGASDLFN